MKDTPMVEIKPTRSAMREFKFRATEKTAAGREIGGLWFVENRPALHGTCQSILEEEYDPRRIGEIIALLSGKMAIGWEASQSSNPRFSRQPFIRHDRDVVKRVCRVLAASQAHISRSRVEVRFLDPDAADEDHLVDAMCLGSDDRRLLEALRTRRGRVGKPLEVFWQIACHLGLARGAEVQYRDFGGGFIPKIQVDNHLLQIEQIPLLNQIEHAAEASCTGLIWLKKRYVDRQTLSFDLESLTFDEPGTILPTIEASHMETWERIQAAMEKAAPQD